MRLAIGGRPAGLASWGYGIVPRSTPKHLFGNAGKFTDYLELCRFFVYDWCPKNTASKFLAVTHRILKKHTNVKWLYTYAAGFQGLVGHIYKAAGYDYLGRTLCDAFLHIEGRGLVHSIALYHRYSKNNDQKFFQAIFPGCTKWCGFNFRYIYWLCDAAERERLLQSAQFELLPYPTEDDLEIWTVDAEGKRTDLTPAYAKTIPIVKLRSTRARSETSDTVADHAAEGGATPTLALPEGAAA